MADRKEGKVNLSITEIERRRREIFEKIKLCVSKLEMFEEMEKETRQRHKIFNQKKNKKKIREDKYF